MKEVFTLETLPFLNTFEVIYYHEHVAALDQYLYCMYALPVCVIIYIICMDLR